MCGVLWSPLHPVSGSHSGIFAATTNLGNVTVVEYVLQLSRLVEDDVAQTTDIGILIRSADLVANDDQLPIA